MNAQIPLAPSVVPIAAVIAEGSGGITIGNKSRYAEAEEKESKDDETAQPAHTNFEDATAQALDVPLGRLQVAHEHANRPEEENVAAPPAQINDVDFEQYQDTVTLFNVVFQSFLFICLF
jgi:hypothetical protein